MTRATKERHIKYGDTVKRLTTEEWLAKGKELFGDDPKLWKFSCANCGHIQTIADFIELRKLGLFDGDVQGAYYSCIGRYDRRLPDKTIGELGDKDKSPCNYTLGGLIVLAKTVVVDDENYENPVFEFAAD